MQQQGHEQPRLSDARGELLQLKLQNIHAGSDRKVSDNTEHCSLLCMGLHSRRPASVPTRTPRSLLKAPKMGTWATEYGRLITTAHLVNILLPDTAAHLQGQDCFVLLYISKYK